MFCSNANKFGFKSKILASNLEPSDQFPTRNNQICFINYDFKENLETFKQKNNNPLSFSKQLFIEAEEVIEFEKIDFEDSTKPLPSIKISPTISKENYIKNVNNLKQHIQQGDIYEINYCITFEAKDVTIDPIAIYQKLNSISKAPYSALAKFNKQYIISSSPQKSEPCN